MPCTGQHVTPHDLLNVLKQQGSSSSQPQQLVTEVVPGPITRKSKRANSSQPPPSKRANRQAREQRQGHNNNRLVQHISKVGNVPTFCPKRRKCSDCLSQKLEMFRLT